jgi:hypothetical protein
VFIQIDGLAAPPRRREALTVRPQNAGANRAGKVEIEA